ncbi:MAG: shikimate kinase [Chloroflexi bacterium]|nr:shikimate kinase [Chloroflexota bacterium]
MAFVDLPQRNNIILVGFMASGKSQVGRILSERTGMPLVDADTVVVERAGKSIEQIFADAGEEAFRSLEREVIAELCGGVGQIISAGGGAFVAQDNRQALLTGGTVFCLQARPETIYHRLKADNDSGQAVRPLLAGSDPLGRIRELLAQRAEAYGQAHHRIDTDELTPEEVAGRVLSSITIGEFWE